jgi:hypothetical protein
VGGVLVQSHGGAVSGGHQSRDGVLGRLRSRAGRYDQGRRGRR